MPYINMGEVAVLVPQLPYSLCLTCPTCLLVFRIPQLEIYSFVKPPITYRIFS